MANSPLHSTYGTHGFAEHDVVPPVLLAPCTNDGRPPRSCLRLSSASHPRTEPPRRSAISHGFIHVQHHLAGRHRSRALVRHEGRCCGLMMGDSDDDRKVASVCSINLSTHFVSRLHTHLPNPRRRANVFNIAGAAVCLHGVSFTGYRGLYSRIVQYDDGQPEHTAKSPCPWWCLALSVVRGQGPCYDCVFVRAVTRRAGRFKGDRSPGLLTPRS
ncbi:hypothetical protein B0T16DRAFT_107429 [Cercophora newfieldiana]|uniref:Uncharacterized protein n=1 Tax=Cercophora newfieldiana TaxID=92897 RepID=A0AA39YJZ7_9PEZI|nr:hypothetical protein B0T16DRAFT_107429 [Cercophora newfieldiana]